MKPLIRGEGLEAKRSTGSRMGRPTSTRGMMGTRNQQKHQFDSERRNSSRGNRELVWDGDRDVDRVSTNRRPGKESLNPLIGEERLGLEALII